MQNFPTFARNASEWFRLKRYLPAARFDTDQWIQQIAKRAVVRKAVEASDQGTLDLMIPQLMLDPLSAYAFQYHNTTTEVHQLQYATRAVVPLSFADLERLQGLKVIFPSIADVAIDEWSATHDQLAALRDFAHLKIDLNARDDDIIASFDAWLQVYRTMANVPPSMHAYQKAIAYEMADWHLSKVLPYFDLTVWSAWSGVKIIEEQIARLLFPRNLQADRGKLKGIKVKVNRILTMTTAMTLSVRR